MGKYLTDISIHVDPRQPLPEGRTQADFNITTHVIQDIFLYNIPPKFEMDGISKLNISIQQDEIPPKIIKYFDGIAVYSYAGFDFNNYFTLPSDEKSALIPDYAIENLNGGFKSST
ncbi:MAG: hypothetical protein M3R08_01520 [Bacteroidota bacterium]|nr:hypothetical protein [Bacteroidota bacterium]